MILARLLYCKKIELVIEVTIVDIANVNRARTQKIRRVRGKVWWVSVSLGFLPAFGFGTLRNGKALSRSFRICW